MEISRKTALYKFTDIDFGHPIHIFVTEGFEASTSMLMYQSSRCPVNRSYVRVQGSCFKLLIYWLFLPLVVQLVTGNQFRYFKNNNEFFRNFNSSFIALMLSELGDRKGIRPAKSYAPTITNKSQSNLALGGIAANWSSDPLNLPFPWGDRGPCLIQCYLRPHECACQMVSHSVQLL